MHGLIFVTWEKYLSERFGKQFLSTYRDIIEETPVNAPLASRVYDDATLMAGVGVACRLTGLAPEVVLREYGRYFIVNGLTRHRCAYLLSQVKNGKELLLTMGQAHYQLSRTPDGLTPPLFGYEAIPGDPEGFVLIYKSARKVCSLLLGAIEGAAELYDEQVRVVEQTCMRKGAVSCRFTVHFFPPHRQAPRNRETPEQQARRLRQRQLADLVFALLPDREGATLQDLQVLLSMRKGDTQAMRPSILLEAIQHLQHVGLVASTANRPGDNLTRRRYWRTPNAEIDGIWKRQQ